VVHFVVFLCHAFKCLMKKCVVFFVEINEEVAIQWNHISGTQFT
jgi:hypothetical protein